MKITFLGATQTVTGSKYLVECDSKKILVDCGLYQGVKELRKRNWEEFPISPAEIDAVILTHAHIDHSGYVPLLVKKGFSGKIYCSHGTKDLCGVLLPDSGRLQEEDAAYASHKGYSKHKPPLPLYTEEEAQESLKYFHPIDYNKDVFLDKNVTLCLTQAGHIIGATCVTIFDGKTSLVFSGDLGRPNDLVMLPPRWIKYADYLVLESTYGSRIHPPVDILDQLEEVINRTIKRNGVVIIPAFSVGRTQSILFGLHILKKAGRLREAPIYLNSPMSIKATDIFCKHRHDHRLSDNQCADTCNIAEYINTVEESKELNTKKGPMVIISASGMLDGGRVLHHIKAFGGDSRNTIVLTGFQSRGTRGEALLRGVNELKIHGTLVPIHAEIVNLDNLSAHADQQEILSWLSHLQKAPKKIFLTHGEVHGAEALQKAIKKKLGWACEIPSYLDSVDLV